MELATQYVVMKLGDETMPDMYLCRGQGGFFWAAVAPQRNFSVVHITTEHFETLLRWYWDTFKGETPLSTWAARHKENYTDFMTEISFGIDNVVFCGCTLYNNGALVQPIRIFEPRLNAVISDDDCYEWFKEKYG